MAPAARRRGRLLGFLLLVLLEALQLFGDFPALRALRESGFDAWQRLAPRERINDSVVVVAIDEASLARLGQWPWPRSQLAQLVSRIAEQRPEVLAVDALFAEPDRLSPQRLAARFEAGGSPELAEALRRMPDSDLQLADALRKLPAVLGVGGLDTESGLAAAPAYGVPVLQKGGDAALWVPRYAAALTSLDLVDRAAAGHGLLNTAGTGAAAGGVARRVPTLALVGDTLMPGLAVETLRVASGETALQARLSSRGLQSLEIAGRSIPTDASGGWRLHFSDPVQRPHLSAADVLEGRAPMEVLQGRIVLLGYTALGLQDNVTTPLGLMPGVELHAEAIENLLDGRLLSRPRWTALAEALLLAAIALGSIYGLPRLRPVWSLAAFAAAATVSAGAGFALFRSSGWLVDALTPLLGGALVFALMLATTLSETQAQRRRLREALAASREAQARLEGELDAARRIQRGMLPSAAERLGGETRIDLAARMIPARSVGGDLYDFELLDSDTLFFLIGDVSGKGLPASLFMALAKALTKGRALGGERDPGEVLTRAGEAIARENPEAMFVSFVAGTLDLRSGLLCWCSAGHEPPARLSTDQPPVWLVGEGGPPLCVIENYRYRSERLQLSPGDTLCLITDGVTEAQNARGAFYGMARLNECLALHRAAATAEELVAAVERDVAGFVGAAEAADDLTLLVLRWQPAPAGFRLSAR